jgi:hypothetical protein
MSPEGQKGRSDPALPLQWEAQALTTFSVHSSTTAERSLRLAGPEDPVPTTYWETRSHGLRARSLLTTKELDLPQVESNLNESPQEYLAVTVECIEV